MSAREVVTELYQRYNLSELPIDRFDPQVRLLGTGGGAVLEGLDGLRAASDRLQAAFDDISFTPVQWRESGERCAVVVDFSARTRPGGEPRHERHGHEWLIRDGLAVEFTRHAGPDEALRSVGAIGDTARP